MSGIDKKPVLSLCIPTWNRSVYLKESLTLLQRQLKEVNTDDVEIYVSDNASIDNTEQVVKDFITIGMPINYNRNSENIGAARNFIKCIQFSTGQYIWLLGDDDFLEDGGLKYLIDILKQGDFGLVHLKNQSKEDGYQIISTKELFLKEMTYWSTFMSGNIFNSDIVDEIKNPEQYIDTHLLQLPFFLRAALNHENNVLINNKLLKQPADSENNGGYNFFEVFVRAYLNIWYSFVEQGMMTKKSYQWEKRNVWLEFSVFFTYKLLIKKENISSDDEKKHNRKGWRIDNGWKIINEFYGKTLYFYVSFLKIIYMFLRDKGKGIVRFCYTKYF